MRTHVCVATAASALLLNRFFYNLVERVADEPNAPAWKSTSKLKPR